MTRLKDLTTKLKEEFGNVANYSDKALADAILSVQIAGKMAYASTKEAYQERKTRQRTPTAPETPSAPGQEQEQPKESVYGIGSYLFDQALTLTRQSANDQSGYDPLKGLLMQGLVNKIGDITGMNKKFAEQAKVQRQPSGGGAGGQSLQELQYIADSTADTRDLVEEMGIHSLDFYKETSKTLSGMSDAIKDIRFGTAKMAESAGVVDFSPLMPIVTDIRDMVEEIGIHNIDFGTENNKLLREIYEEDRNKNLRDLEASRESDTISASTKAVIQEPKKEEDNGILGMLMSLFGARSILVRGLGLLTRALPGLVNVLSKVVSFVAAVAPIVATIGKFLLRFAGPIGLLVTGAMMASDAYAAVTKSDDKKEVVKPKAKEEKGSAPVKPASKEVERALDVGVKEFQMDKKEISGVAQRESSMDPNARSDIGAKGLFQITEDTWNSIVKDTKNKEMVDKYNISPIAGDKDQRTDPVKNTIVYGLLQRDDAERYKETTGNGGVDRYIKHFLGGPTGNDLIKRARENPNEKVSVAASRAYKASKTNRQLMQDENGDPLTNKEFIAKIEKMIKEDQKIAQEKLSKLNTDTVKSSSSSMNKVEEYKEKRSMFDFNAKKLMTIPAESRPAPAMPGSPTPIISPGSSRGVLPSRNPSSTLQRLLDRDAAAAQ